MNKRFVDLHRLSRIGWLLTCIPFISPALADPFHQDFRSYPFISAAYALQPSADLDSQAPGTTVETKETQLVLGLFQFDAGESKKINFGVDYQYTRYVYENVDGRNRDLHRLQFPLGFGHQGSTWSLTGFVAPGVATSSNVLKDYFDRGSSDDLILTGRLESSFRQNHGLSWLGGIAYDRAFGSAKPYPVFGLIYRTPDEFSLRFAFPDSAIRYVFSERHRLSLNLFPAGSEWHVVSDDLNDEFDYEVEAIRLQATWSYRFFRSVRMDLSFGYEFDRRHRFVDDTGQNIDSDLGSQWLITAGLRWGDGPIPLTHRLAR